MATWCLPQKETTAFLEALRNGTIDPVKMMDMTSAERRALFEGIVGPDNAKEINTQFESKMLLKDQQAGMVRWAKKVAGLNEKTRSDLVSKINGLKEVLQPEDERKFLEDLAEKKLGVSVTADEAHKISDLARVAFEERQKPTSNLSGVSDESLMAESAMRHYINSIKPTSAFASIGKNAAIIARNNLLMNPATPIKTTVGQIVNYAMDAVTRRVGALSLGGENPELARQANKEAWATFRKTGMNTASMEDLNDTGMLGEKNRFDVPEGMLSSHPVVHGVESAVRNVAKVSNKIAIDWEHNIAFTKFYQKSFYDMLNVASSSIARAEGLSGTAVKARAADIFKDASRIEPETDVGALIRMEGQKQAARVTSTNETYISRLAIGVKDALNKAVNGLGDALMPIAKIPANIIWNGIENAGVGLPIGARDIFEGRAKIQSASLATRYEGMAQFSNGVQRIARVVGSLGAAAYFSSLLTKQDFRSDNYGNHFVRIGDVWINMEYVNAISPALAGMMTVKKDGGYNDTFSMTVSHYVSGALQGLKSAPGIDELSSLVHSITNKNFITGTEKYLKDFFTSRGEPAFVANLLKDRPIDRLFFGAHGVETNQQVHADARAAQAGRRTRRDVWGELVQ